MKEYIVKIPKRMANVDASYGIKHGEDQFILALFKVVCGYWNGRTFNNFMVELGFATEELDAENREYHKATEFGKKFLYHYYNDQNAKSKFVFETE